MDVLINAMGGLNVIDDGKTVWTRGGFAYNCRLVVSSGAFVAVRGGRGQMELKLYSFYWFINSLPYCLLLRREQYQNHYFCVTLSQIYQHTS